MKFTTPVTGAKLVGTSNGRVIKLRTPLPDAKTPGRQFRVHTRISQTTPIESIIGTETITTSPTTPANARTALPRRLFANPVTPHVKISVKGKPERTQPTVGSGRAGPLEKRLVTALDSGCIDMHPRPPFVSRFTQLPLHATRVTLRARSCVYISSRRIRILVDDDGHAGLLLNANADVPNLWRSLQVQHTKAPEHLMKFLLDQAEQHQMLDGDRPRLLEHGTPQFRIDDCA